MADVLQLCDKDKVTACSLPFPSYICAQKQMTEKEGGEKKRENHFINPCAVLFLFISWSSS